MAFTYVGKFLSGMKGFYDEINPSTLSGAIDVIVVQQEDGTFLCSPFHVKFGKLGVIRSREKIVDIEINEVYVEDLHMKLGDSGEAFFVQEIESDQDETELPDDLATSPIWSGTEDGGAPVNQAPPSSPTLIDTAPPPSAEVDMAVDDALHVNQIVFREGEADDVGAVVIAPALPTDDLAPLPPMTPDLDGGKESTTNAVIKGKEGFNAKPVGTRRKKKNHKRATVKNEEILSHLKNASGTQGSKVRFKVPAAALPPLKTDEDTIFPMENETIKPALESPPELLYTSARPSFSQAPGVGTSLDSSFEAGLLPLTLPGGRGYGLNNSRIVAFSENDLASYISAKTEEPFFNDPERYKSDTEIEMGESSANKSHLTALLPQPTSPYACNVVEWSWGKLPERKSNSQPSSPDKIYSLLLADSLKESRELMEAFNKQSGAGKKDAIDSAKAIKGVYLDDLKNGEMDPELAAAYFPQRPNPKFSFDATQRASLEEYVDSSSNSASSPVPTSLADHALIEYPSSPSSIAGSETLKEETDIIDSGVALSLCGSLDQGNELNLEVNQERFERYKLSYEDVVKDPSIFLNPELICRLNEKYYSWQIAVPIIASLYLYNKPLPDSTLESFAKLLPPKRSVRSSWFPWRSRYRQQYPHHKVSIESAPGIVVGDVLNNPSDPGLKMNHLKRSTSFDSSHPATLPNGDINKNFDEHTLVINRKTTERCRKTLRLTSDQIVKLNLVTGCNDVTFSVTTQFQGTTRCASHIFLWRYDDKIVISDIDGTITKSDVLGHIFPFLGKDWSQLGVAELYSRISKNGYQFVYLSSRAIGQAPGTRGYLKSLKQNNMPLPEGPILLNPNSLLTAFHKEVIEKKPEEFKISCLRDIRVLFPAPRNPFFAGFGNRINDVYAYRAVDIPISRIFTINHRGEITVELTKTFQSSYTKLQDLVDQLFPPLKQLERKRVTDLLEADKFSSFTYWRTPMQTLDEVGQNGELELEENVNTGGNINADTEKSEHQFD